MKIYWGDIHNHCGITYGFGSLENALKRAAVQLDFCCVTGHAMWPDMYEKKPETEFIVEFHQTGFKKLKDHWEEIRQMVEEAGNGDMVTFQSYELHSSEYGDYHIVSKNGEMPLIYRQSPAKLVEDCGKDETIAVPHHIGYPGGYRGIDWSKYNPEISPIVEVYSKHGCSMSEDADYPYYHDMGPREITNTIYAGLEMGYKFGFAGSTDHHAGYPGSYGDGRIAVLAKEKTREAIWEAWKKRRTYAVTGDKIQCDFRINGALIGSEITGNERRITYHVETEYALDKIVLYKNLKPFHILNGEFAFSPAYVGKYKIRVEMGWGNQELYSWNGAVEVIGGTICGYNPYFRGRSVLSPTAVGDYDLNNVNDMKSEIHQESGTRLAWSCDTVGNQSTLHPCTSSVLIEIEGMPETSVKFDINGKVVEASIEELCQKGYTVEMEYYHSQSFKVYRALPASKYHFDLELCDREPENACDFYHIEVSQKNRQWAYVTPIWVNMEGQDENIE